MPVNKKKFKISLDKGGNIDIDKTLFQHRHIFISDVICSVSADEVIRELLVLDMISNRPIQIYITSPGGRVDWGFAIIDIMKNLRSKVITIANGQVASMGTMIAIAGDERKCFENTTFMFHDMFSGVVDYSQKMKARLEYTEKLYNSLETHMKKYTNLSKKEIDLSRNEELWIFSDEAVKKGLVDIVIK